MDLCKYTNQILVSFGVVNSFLSLKWAKNEKGLCSVHSKASWISKHEESKSWRASKPLPIQSSEQGGESEKESNIH